MWPRGGAVNRGSFGLPGAAGKDTEAAGSTAVKPETSCVIPHTHHLTKSSAGQLGQQGPSHVTAGASGSDKAWTGHTTTGPSVPGCPFPGRGL